MSAHLDADNQRKHRTHTAKAMKAMVKRCPSCGRGQYPRRFDVGDGRRGNRCRYCQHEWTAK